MFPVTTPTLEHDTKSKNNLEFSFSLLPQLDSTSSDRFPISFLIGSPHEETSPRSQPLRLHLHQ